MEYSDRGNNKPVGDQQPYNKYNNSYSHNKGKSYQSDKVRMANLEREITDLKSRLNSLEQCFDGDKAYRFLDKISVRFSDGTSEDYTDVKIKKFTIEAKDIRGNTVHIYKNNIVYYRDPSK